MLKNAKLSIISDYDKVRDAELICRLCAQDKKLEELKFVEVEFANPANEDQILIVRVNACISCLQEAIKKGPAGKVIDVFGGTNK